MNPRQSRDFGQDFGENFFSDVVIFTLVAKLFDASISVIVDHSSVHHRD